MGTAKLIGGAALEVVPLELITDVARAPYAVLHVSGEVDLYTAPQLRERLACLVRKGNYAVVVDLEGVEFLDSTGLRVLVESRQRLRSAGGVLRVVCTRRVILKTFEITGLDKVMPPYRSVEEALAS